MDLFSFNCTAELVISPQTTSELSDPTSWLHCFMEIFSNCLTLYCSRFFSLLVSVSSRSLWMAAICLFLSLIAWSRDLSSFLIHLSLSSLEVNWLPRPCLAYRSVLSCVAWASLKVVVATEEVIKWCSELKHLKISQWCGSLYFQNVHVATEGFAFSQLHI